MSASVSQPTYTSTGFEWQKFAQPEMMQYLSKRLNWTFILVQKNDSAWLLPQARSCLGDNASTLSVGSNGKCVLFFFLWR